MPENERNLGRIVKPTVLLGGAVILAELRRRVSDRSQKRKQWQDAWQRDLQIRAQEKIVETLTALGREGLLEDLQVETLEMGERVQKQVDATVPVLVFTWARPNRAEIHETRVDLDRVGFAIEDQKTPIATLDYDIGDLRSRRIDEDLASGNLGNAVGQASRVLISLNQAAYDLLQPNKPIPTA